MRIILINGISPVYFGFCLAIVFELVSSIAGIKYVMQEPHKLFTKIIEINSSFTIYQHRLQINQPAQLPCTKTQRQKNIFHYEWLMNGRQIRTHTPFVYGTWDLDGVLTILSIIPRSTTLWCHVRVEEKYKVVDVYYGHQLTFYEKPIHYLMFGISLAVEAMHEPMQQKCDREQGVCDCRTTGGPNAVALNIKYIKEVAVQKEVRTFAERICRELGVCLAVSQDEFTCVNDMIAKWAYYYMEFTVSIFGGYYAHVNQPSRLIKSGEILQEVFEEIFRVARETIYGVSFDLADKITRRQGRTDLKAGNRTQLYCMGYAATLNLPEEECELCPPGSHADSHYVSPSPPSPSVVTRSDPQSRTICLPCPRNTYTEEMGRINCLSCPDWHTFPEELEGTTRYDKEGNRLWTGSDWIHLVCPPEGREEVRLIQVVKGMLGSYVAYWLAEAGHLKRVGVMAAFIFLPLAIAVILVFIAYVVIDVGAALINMADQLRPLQIHLAEIAMVTSQLKAEQRTTAEELYFRLRSGRK